MIDVVHVLIGFPDYGRQANGRLFVWDGATLNEVTFEEASKSSVPFVCLDYGPLAAEFVNRAIDLPASVLDIVELFIFASKENDLRKIRRELDFFVALARFGLDSEELSVFRTFSFSTSDFSEEVLESVGRAIERMFRTVSRWASIRQEWDRFWHIEAPVTRILYSHIMRGIEFDRARLSQYREDAEYEFYSALKKFSAKHNLPLSVPNRSEQNDILSGMGFDLSNTSPEFVFEYIALENDLGTDLNNLKSVRAVRDALSGISHKKSVTYPEVLVHGTRTSRTIIKVPSLQNLSARYRDVLKPSPSKQFSYVDYDQFEVGIMAALSEDPKLLEFYNSHDLYVEVSAQLFGTPEKRKQAKRLFLSYAYGMSMPNLMKAATSFGSEKKDAKSVFSQFSAYEEWKQAIAKQLAETRKIGTSYGNFFHLAHTKKPSAKDLRSAVSQKVQGTGALIFKRSLLALSEFEAFRIVLPMHDAVLVEHAIGVDPAELVEVFEKSMTSELGGKVKGKASLTNFVP